jgi:hypothetical protein
MKISNDPQFFRRESSYEIQNASVGPGDIVCLDRDRRGCMHANVSKAKLHVYAELVGHKHE